MIIDNLQPKQDFKYEGRKFRAHRVDVFYGRVWVETTTGVLICDRLGTFVETNP